MRLAVPLLAFGLLAAPAFAQAQAQQPPASPAPSVAPAAQAPQQPEAKAEKHRQYLSLPKRFEMANTTHDGRLTLEQAKAAKVMRTVARNFDEIDATHKGYVTEDDIRNWYKARRAARHAAEHATKS